MKELQVEVHGTNGEEIEKRTIQYEEKIHKLIVTVDTSYLMSTGIDSETLKVGVRQLADQILLELSQDTPILIVPQYIKLRVLNIDGLDFKGSVKHE
jgi:hypothetical protein